MQHASNVLLSGSFLGNGVSPDWRRGRKTGRVFGTLPAHSMNLGSSAHLPPGRIRRKMDRWQKPIGGKNMPDRSLRIGFRTSIIAIFVGTVLFVGLSLVYLSFERVGAITRTAAASFLDTVAQLSADRIDAQFMAVRDGLDILQDLPSVRSAAVRDNPRLYALLASMLRNNRQLYSLYAGYDDGKFVQMDYLERGGDAARLRSEAPEAAKFRLVVISGPARADSTIDFLRDDLSSVERRPGSTDYDPRRRPWYAGAFEKDLRPLTEPYIFFAIGQPGYTLRMPIPGSPRGVVAGDILTGKPKRCCAGSSSVARAWSSCSTTRTGCLPTRRCRSYSRPRKVRPSNCPSSRTSTASASPEQSRPGRRPAAPNRYSKTPTGGSMRRHSAPSPPQDRLICGSPYRRRSTSSTPRSKANGADCS
ncbi:hypothetical protein [Bradyrhizobium sp. DOA1]|uniref:hypothetical protein n=1 Tax=Bradyrhizobium sp. DOA1 TaxID=1126616 RepID=UPI001FDA46BC|nr:hypothetical protein [Bradyrhizobium sp. DOA1]